MVYQALVPHCGIIQSFSNKTNDMESPLTLHQEASHSPLNLESIGAGRRGAPLRSIAFIEVRRRLHVISGG